MNRTDNEAKEGLILNKNMSPWFIPLSLDMDSNIRACHWPLGLVRSNVRACRWKGWKVCSVRKAVCQSHPLMALQWPLSLRRSVHKFCGYLFFMSTWGIFLEAVWINLKPSGWGPCTVQCQGTLKNLRWLKISDPSIPASLIIILWFLERKTPEIVIAKALGRNANFIALNDQRSNLIDTAV